MSKSTLKQTIIIRTIGSIVFVSLFAILIFMGQSYLKSTYAKNMITDSLKKSSDLQSQQILPTLLLEEQSSGLKLILDKILKEEDLAEINFVKPNMLKTIGLEKCRETNIDSCDEFVNGNVVIVKPIKSGTELFGYLVKTKFYSPFVFHHQSINNIEILLIFLFFMFIIQFISLSRLTSKTVPRALNDLVVWVQSSLENKSPESKPNLSFKEFEELAAVIYKLIKEREVTEAKANMAQIAAQVSHDIRSPLSALSTIAGQLQNVTEQQRLIVRSSVQRITDITNQLLQKSKEIKRSSSGNHIVSEMENTSQSYIQLIAPLIDMIVSEKRIEFREKQGIEIEACIEQSYGLFANIDSTELKRSLSNLITNSCEALTDFKGKVSVGVNRTGNLKDQVSIFVRDNGKGMPRHILEKLGQEGITHGKEGTQSGNGLGVYHTIKIVKTMGGTVKIDSIPGQGTTVTLTLPLSKPPKWFVEKLVLSTNSTICSLDDDLFIHQVWSDRFDLFQNLHKQLKYFSFTSGFEFKKWMRSQMYTIDSKSSRLYLVDYELLNQSETGLDIIEEFGIGAQAVLVSSRYEEETIRERCDKLGVRLIPKAMAGFVPIEIEIPKVLFDGILVDDDSLQQMTWSLTAKNKNKKFVGFTTANDFFVQSGKFDRSSPLFVDSNLGNGIKGEDIAQKAFDMGFENIYIATGYEPRTFPYMPWIKGIVGKDPFPTVS